MSEINAVNVRTADEIESATVLPTNEIMMKIAESEDATVESIRVAKADKGRVGRECAMAASFLRTAKLHRKYVPGWGKAGYKKLMDQMELRAKLEHAITEVRMDVAIKVHGFVESMKPSNPLVAKVSYYRLKQFFIPMFAWNADDMAGEIRKEWLTFLRNIIDRNADGQADNPMSIDELKEAIDDERKRQAAEKAAKDKRTPESIDAAEQKEANRKRIAKRQAAVTSIGKVIGNAIDDAELDGADIADTVKSVAKAYGVTIPAEMVAVPTGFDPAVATMDDIRKLMAVLYANGKMDEIRLMVEIGTKMVASVDTGTVRAVA